MSTATQDRPTPAAPAPSHAPEPLDPENDIDAKSATYWVLGGTVALFACLWLLLPIFLRILVEERKVKIDDVPNTELAEVREVQDQFLDGANPKKISLDQAIQDALKK